jgi:hypothetical protein
MIAVVWTSSHLLVADNLEIYPSVKEADSVPEARLDYAALTLEK